MNFCKHCYCHYCCNWSISKSVDILNLKCWIRTTNVKHQNQMLRSLVTANSNVTLWMFPPFLNPRFSGPVAFGPWPEPRHLLRMWLVFCISFGYSNTDICHEQLLGYPNIAPTRFYFLMVKMSKTPGFDPETRWSQVAFILRSLSLIICLGTQSFGRAEMV